MTYSPNLGTILHRLLLLAVSVFLLVSPTLAQSTTWDVTISVTAGTSTLAYQHPGPGDTCSTAHPVQPTSGSDLYVCQGDTVNWHFQGLTHSEMYIIHHDHIMHDNNGDRTGFHGSDGNPDGGTINTNATKAGHKYCVFVWDPGTQTPYFDDPKIMIGGKRASGSKGHAHGQDKKSSSAQ